jgi:glycosyltransferase involved in cell wall biosynthesis
MRIAYILDRPELNGGVKVVFQHGRILAQLGHSVTITGRGARPWWVDGGIAYQDRDVSARLPPQDLVIATWYETIPVALGLSARSVAHLCQGFEGDLVHLAGKRDQIDAAYACQLPTLVVSPHLATRLGAMFGRSARVARPPLDPGFRPAWRWRPRLRPWIWIPGIFEADCKGVRFALEAITLLRAAGVTCCVLRSSTWPLSEAESSILAPDRYLCGVHPTIMAREVRRCDLLMLPCLPAEGFGLPAIEALAAKVPVVASDLPSMRFIGAHALALVPPGNARALGHASLELLADAARWRSARADGYAAVHEFAAHVSSELDSAVRWALDVPAASATEQRLAAIANTAGALR